MIRSRWRPGIRAASSSNPPPGPACQQVGLLLLGRLFGALLGLGLALLLLLAHLVLVWLARAHGVWDPMHDLIFALLGAAAGVLALHWGGDRDDGADRYGMTVLSRGDAPCYGVPLRGSRRPGGDGQHGNRAVIAIAFARRGDTTDRNRLAQQLYLLVAPQRRGIGKASKLVDHLVKGAPRQQLLFDQLQPSRRGAFNG
ncbi:hypothetical protein ACFSUD_05240 [Sulfitobacter aestuarii]|uniref:N-acetyltransferase domain-containing protein n=1 Tax=Sulfitobacter aestuarii TaxID=2161676 RepID=A0ABW5TZ69_9RHOB